MIYTMFASNRQGVMALLLVPVVAAGALSYAYCEPQPSLLAGPLYDVILAPLKAWPWLGVLVSSLAIMAGALMVNVIFNRHDYASRENFMPSLFYVGFFITDPCNFQLNPLPFANLLLLMALWRLLGVYRQASPTYMLFDAGIFFGLAILVYPLFALLLPLIWIGLFRLRPFSIREWMLPLAGVLTPALYAAVAYWWLGYYLEIDEFLTINWSFSPHFRNSGSSGFFNVLSIGLGVVGAGRFIADMGVSTVHRKNSKAVWMWFAVFTLLAYFFGLSLEANEARLHLALLPVPVVFMAVLLTGKGRPIVLMSFFYIWVAAAIWQFWQNAAINF